MKKRFRKTGEVVDVINYSAPYLGREKDDYVSYIDSKGIEHVTEYGLNIQWDFEDVKEELTKGIDWEEVRGKAAIAAMKGILSNESIEITLNQERSEYCSIPIDIAKAAITYADALIAELEKGGNQ